MLRFFISGAEVKTFTVAINLLRYVINVGFSLNGSNRNTALRLRFSPKHPIGKYRRVLNSDEIFGKYWWRCVLRV